MQASVRAAAQWASDTHKRRHVPPGRTRRRGRRMRPVGRLPEPSPRADACRPSRSVSVSWELINSLCIGDSLGFRDERPQCLEGPYRHDTVRARAKFSLGVDRRPASGALDIDERPINSGRATCHWAAPPGASSRRRSRGQASPPRSGGAVPSRAEKLPTGPDVPDGIRSPHPRPQRHQILARSPVLETGAESHIDSLPVSETGAESENDAVTVSETGADSKIDSIPDSAAGRPATCWTGARRASSG